jgi:cell division protein FtsB
MKRKRKLGPVLLFLGLVILSAVLFFSGDYSVFRLLETKESRERVKMEISGLNEKIEKQKQTNELLQNKDSLEMEKKARERGMIKEGETIYKYEIEKEN